MHSAQDPPLSAFADESFQEHPDDGFYILAAAIFEPSAHEDVRAVMRGLRGRHPSKLHWKDLERYQRRTAIKTVADLDGFHVVTIGSPVPSRRQERARAACLTRLVWELHALGVRALHMEARQPELNRRDVRTVLNARFALPGGTDFQVHHRFGVDEPLFWVADIVAGAIRAHRQNDSGWRELLVACLHEVEVPTGC
ncbi:MAG TPA: DUF3800 domain-containing protein [Pseudonocardiaceae bacterium]|nr:DUF3800 domain-containing protein [Pseudonocardiaceae bacterium]